MQFRSLAPLVPLALVTLLVGCAAQGPQSEQAQNQSQPTVASPQDRAQFDPVHFSQAQFGNNFQAQLRASQHHSSVQQEADDAMATASDDDIAQFADSKPYQLPPLADSILERGMSLIGTRYRFGGTSTAGFDCSGFIGYLFHEQAGMTLPRSTRDMINLDVPKVARNDLRPGDLLFFSTKGRGRVSHAGIYLGDDQFIHSSSRRGGGVRVDNLDDAYWKKTFIEAKRALAMAPTSVAQQQVAR